jgi:hypothetical protein
MTDFRNTWIEQCEAAEEIRENFGKEKAIGYLVGEKFINALRDALRYPEVQAEIPAFAARIREIVEPQDLITWFANVRRIGALGHIATEAQYQLLVEADALESGPVAVAEDILALERAREILLPH